MSAEAPELWSRFSDHLPLVPVPHYRKIPRHLKLVISLCPTFLSLPIVITWDCPPLFSFPAGPTILHPLQNKDGTNHPRKQNSSEILPSLWTEFCDTSTIMNFYELLNSSWWSIVVYGQNRNQGLKRLWPWSDGYCQSALPVAWKNVVWDRVVGSKQTLYLWALQLRRGYLDRG